MLCISSFGCFQIISKGLLQVFRQTSLSDTITITHTITGVGITDFSRLTPPFNGQCHVAIHPIAMLIATSEHTHRFRQISIRKVFPIDCLLQPFGKLALISIFVQPFPCRAAFIGCQPIASESLCQIALHADAFLIALPQLILSGSIA